MNIVNNEPFSHIFGSMSTKCSIKFYDGTLNKIKQVCQQVEENTKYLEKKYNFYDKNSYLNSFINERKKSKIKIDEKTAEILKNVKEFSKLTNYLFDISIGTYKHCYMYDDIEKFKECLAKLEDKVGDDTWDISGRYLEFKYQETKFDLGGVIKEYAVDEAARILQENQIKSAIINYGGDIYALGKKPNGDFFKIGVKNPKDKEQNLLTLQVENQGLTTSAHYERSYQIGDNKFSHILSKRGNTKGILSATIMSESVLKSGIFSTSFMIDTHIDIPSELKVVLIDDNLNIHQNIVKN